MGDSFSIKRKKIGVFMNSVKINDEPGYTRFISIAEILSNNGFDVELITSTFQHWQKKHRDIENTDLSNYNFTFKFIRYLQKICESF